MESGQLFSRLLNAKEEQEGLVRVMEKLSGSAIWKVRTIKNYPEAHTHLLVGRVLDITDSYVRLHCRTYHFQGVVSEPDDIQIGSVMVRVVPWSRIEIINELPEGFDYVKSTVIADKVGQILFKDKEHACPVGFIPSGGDVKY